VKRRRKLTVGANAKTAEKRRSDEVLLCFADIKMVEEEATAFYRPESGIL